jgi:hypothetical protein
VLEKPVRELLTEVSVLAGGLGGGAVGEYPKHDLAVMALFDRCRSMFGAIQLLLSRDFVHEAVLLGRPLFTDSLILVELAALDAKGRAELVLGWSLASLADFEGIYRDAQTRGDDVDAELDKLAEQRKQLESDARRQSLKRRRMPDEKQLAQRHGRADEYGAYRLTSHFVHGSTMAVSQRYTKADDETVMVGGPAALLEDWALDAGLFGAYSLLHASRAVCHIFGWPEPPELDELLQRIDRLLAERAADDPERE